MVIITLQCFFHVSEFYEPSVYSFETIKNYLETSIDNISKYYLAKDHSKFKTLIKDYYFNKSISSGNKNEVIDNC